MAKGKKTKKVVKKAVLSNVKFAETESFIKACNDTKDAGYKVIPTSRQASKFRNKKGIVFLFTSGRIGGTGK